MVEYKAKRGLQPAFRFCIPFYDDLLLHIGRSAVTAFTPVVLVTGVLVEFLTGFHEHEDPGVFQRL